MVARSIVNVSCDSNGFFFPLTPFYYMYSSVTSSFPPPPLLNQDVSLPSDDLEIQHRRLPCPVVHSDNKLSHIRFCICTYVDHFQDSLLRAYFGFRFRQQKLSTRLNDKNHAISLWYFFQYRWKAICMNIGSWGSYFFKNGTEHCRQKPSIAIAIPLAWARQVWHLR